MSDLDLLHKNEGIAGLINLLKEQGERRILRRKEFFIREGEFHDEVAYVLRGSLKYFIHDYRGREQIISFAFDHELVACYLPARNASKAVLNVQALEESVIVVLPLDALLPMIQLEAGERVYVHNMVESFAFDLLQKNLAFRRDSPELRYRRLLDHVPDILNRVSIKEIASYIGVTPETLSRIRTRLLHEDI